MKRRIFSRNPILISIRNRPAHISSHRRSPPLVSPCPPTGCSFAFDVFSGSFPRSSRGSSRESVDIPSDMLSRERKTLWRLLISLFFLAVRARYSRPIGENIPFASWKFINSVARGGVSQPYRNSYSRRREESSRASLFGCACATLPFLLLREIVKGRMRPIEGLPLRRNSARRELVAETMRVQCQIKIKRERAPLSEARRANIARDPGGESLLRVLIIIIIINLHAL